jgi:endonuclease YncB( thermonuclease family)
MDILETATSDIPEFSLKGLTIRTKVVACYDGDTFHAAIPFAGQLWKFPCRMAGYDTPEMKPPVSKPDRELEKARALRAKQALLSWVCDGVDVSGTYTKSALDTLVKTNRRVIEMTCGEFDKYGRLLVTVPCAAVGASTVNEWMVQHKYGYAYSGDTKDTTFATAA